MLSCCCMLINISSSTDKQNDEPFFQTWQLHSNALHALYWLGGGMLKRFVSLEALEGSRVCLLSIALHLPSILLIPHTRYWLPRKGQLHQRQKL